MSNSPQISPLYVTDADPGDDTQLRFRYQSAYAAILSLSLLDDDVSNIELYCEHHEDILLKTKEGLFHGIQVKTRSVGLDPFKAVDDEIKKTLKRFLDLEIRFGDHFFRYTIATNCGFWRGEKNGSNLAHIQTICIEATRGGITTPRVVTLLLNKIINKKEYSQITDLPKLFVNVLNKLVLEDSLPKLLDVENRLTCSLSSLPEYSAQNFQVLKKSAAALRNKMFELASLNLEAPIIQFLILKKDVKKAKQNAVIDSKRITREAVISLLAETLMGEELLRVVNPVSIKDLPESITRLEKKMALGGIKISNINLAKDHKYSTLSMLTRWLHRYGKDKANSRYNHLKTLVQTECQEAHDANFDLENTFGEKMLTEVRQRLRQRSDQSADVTLNCDYIHLLGIAGILTEECTIWWSKEIPVEEFEVKE